MDTKINKSDDIKEKNNKINIKNVIKLKKQLKKDNFNSNNKKNKITIKCNRIISKSKSSYSDIYSKIDKFNNNGKKTIVYFIDSFYPNIDGVVMVMENYVKYMSQYYNVVVCAPRHKNYSLRFDKYFVLFSDAISVKSQGYDLGFPQFDSRFQKFISLLKIDLVHIHSPFNMGTFGVKLAKKRKIPSIITFHSQFKRDFYETTKSELLSNILTKIILYTFNNASLTLTMNAYSKKLLQNYGLKKNIEIISNATNMTRKEFDEIIEDKILNRYKINKQKFNIIFIGRLVKVKNVWFILETIKELLKINNKFEFIIMGDGPERDKMQKFCSENKIEKHVNFLGKILDSDEKSIIIKNSNLLFFPSIYDTDGIVKIECACYDVPSVCIENTGASSNIIDNINGFLIKEDINDAVQKLDYLIKNVDYVKNIGKKSNLDIYKTWDDVCFELRKIYKKYFNKKYLKNK